MQPIKISPSKLSFSLEECPRCFWLDVRHGISFKSFSGMPSVFGKIDKSMREFYHGQSPSALFSHLPHGRFDTTDRRLTSSLIQVPGRKTAIYFTGKLDALALSSDGTCGIIDFKTSESKDQHLKLYKRQLHAYLTLLENPKSGNPMKPTYMGLIAVSPIKMRHDGLDALLQMKQSWQEIAIDRAWWHTFLESLVDLLEHPDPQGKANCQYCQMQRILKPLPTHIS